MLLPPSMWMVVSGTTTLYPTSAYGATSTTAGNSFIITPSASSSTFKQNEPQRRPAIRVWGYLIVTPPAASGTITIESHDGAASHVSTTITAVNAQFTYVTLGSGILLPAGLRVTLSVAATVNVYFSFAG